MVNRPAHNSVIAHPPASTLRDYVYIIILIAVTFLLYSNTLMVPFYFDDYASIVEQPHLHGLDQVVNLLFSHRGFAKLTFALNYYLGGQYLPGFHMANIFIHAGSTVVFYLILKRIFKESLIYPLLCSLFFAVHPVQTQAVTYIVQRMTSLAGFLFLLALYLYIRFREKSNSDPGTSGIHAIVFWIIAFFAGALALLSKENAVVLPVALYFFDWYFMNGRSDGWRRILIRTLPFAIVPCLYSWFFFIAPLLKGTAIVSMASTVVTLNSSTKLTPYTYFVTQFSVIWTYIRILFVPFGITLDYGYPVVDKVLTLRNIVAGTGLAGLLVLAYKVRYAAPRISFGIVWFFLTLAVESSFIPLDPVFIHRLYLPIAGFTIVVMDILMRLPWRSSALFIVSILIGINAIISWQRNVLWNDPVAFYEDNLRKTPHNERIKGFLALSYMQRDRNEDAIKLLKEVISTNPSLESAIVTLSDTYIKVGRRAEAIELLEKHVRIKPMSYKFHNSLGSLYSMAGRNELAEYHLKYATQILPRSGEAYSNLGAHFAGLKKWEDAESQYRKALIFSPNSPDLHFNLGLMMLEFGRRDEARFEFRQALALDPKESDLIYNLALGFVRLGDHQTAKALLLRLRGINHEMAEKLASEITLSEITN